MACVINLWRHPIKGVGREALQSVVLEAGKTMPWDRHWALAHENAKIDPHNPEWMRCSNFARAARGHKLMAVSSALDKSSGQITLHHPELDSITVNPDKPTDAQTLIDWVTKISNPNRSLPAHVVKVPGRGMTDSSTPSLSIHTKASLDDFSEKLGAPLDQRRFRGNIWIEGTEPWEEFTWIGRTVRIGEAEFEITKPVERCMATTVNPDTGVSDQDTLGVLEHTYGHLDFGVFGIVTKPGLVQTGDTFEVV